MLAMGSSKLLINIILLTTFIISEQAVFECHGDVCNVNKRHQFCSQTFKYCRDCKTIKDECGTPTQPLNCTGFCQEMAVTEALKEDKERNEISCLVVPPMLNIANGNVAAPEYNDSRVPVGSTLVYTCDSGYSLEGPDTIRCLRNLTWNQQAMPYCLDNACLGYKMATKVLIAISSAFAVALVLVIIKAFCCKESKVKGGMSRTSTGMSLLDEEKRLIGDRGADAERETPLDQIRTSGPDHSNDSKASNAHAAVPTAPSAELNNEDIDGNEPQNAENRNHSFNQDSRVQPIVIKNEFNIINQQLTDNVPKPPERHGNTEETAEEGNFRDNGKRMKDSSIDEKKPTKESNEIDAVEETAEEKEGKGRGTKPLPARDSDAKFETIAELSKDSEARGPQPVAVKEEYTHATQETGLGHMSEKVGLLNITCPKSDIKTQNGIEPSTKVNQKMFNLKEDRGTEALQAREEDM